MYIVPAAGSTPISLIQFARSIKHGLPVYSFDTPNPDEDQSFFESIECVAESYLAEMRTIQPAGPYYLAGQCSGAIVAMEMANQLENMNMEVMLLITLESIAPKPIGDDNSNEVKTEHALKKMIQKTTANVQAKLNNLPAAVVSHYEKLTWHQINMADNYQANRLKAPIVVIRTEGTEQILFEGWQQFSSSCVTQHTVPGNTTTMLSPPHAKEVAEIVVQAMRLSES